MSAGSNRSMLGLAPEDSKLPHLSVLLRDASLGDGRAHHAPKHRFELSLHLGRLQDAESACYRFEGGQPLLARFAAYAPTGGLASQESDPFGLDETGNSLGDSSRLTPVSIRDHQGDRALVRFDELAREGVSVL